VTLNSGPDIHATVREELDALVQAFMSNGGSITPGRHHRVALSCASCRAHRYLDLGYYLNFHPCCLRCGGEMKPEW
jgi:hypothetical protein